MGASWPQPCAGAVSPGRLLLPGRGSATPVTGVKETGWEAGGGTGARRSPDARGAALGGGLAVTPAARAAGLMVRTTAASGAGSLRPAILIANANSGADQIGITATGSLTLAGALPAITDDLSIVGPGRALLTISGANQFRVFSVQSGTVTLADLTIANGLGQGGAGVGGGCGGGAAGRRDKITAAPSRRTGPRSPPRHHRATR